MITEQLKKTILRELELEEFELNEETRAHQVPGWDSLNHARIIAAVEDEFQVRFSTVEILKLKNIGDLQTLINAKKRPPPVLPSQ